MRLPLSAQLVCFLIGMILVMSLLSGCQTHTIYVPQSYAPPTYDPAARAIQPLPRFANEPRSLVTDTYGIPESYDRPQSADPWYASRNDLQPGVYAGPGSPPVRVSTVIREYDRRRTTSDGRVRDHFQRQADTLIIGSGTR